MLECLKMALLANKSELAVLPKFEALTRQKMKVTVSVKTMILSLRNIIGNRQTMLRRG